MDEIDRDRSGTRSASAGRIDGMLLVAFPDLSAQADGTETVLTGPLVDQAALYGLLAQLKRWVSNCSRSAAPAG